MSRAPTPAEIATADLLVRGSGTPRSREQIAREVVGALVSARDEGRADGELAARTRVLREAEAILEGIRQDVDARLRAVERELTEAGLTEGVRSRRA